MEQGRSNVSVRLLVYSGRPDPEWELGDEAVKGLRERLGKVLDGERTNPPPHGNLGYRGFLVRSDGRAGLPRELTVFRKVVTENDGRSSRHWRDDAGVEDMLLGDARAHDHGELLTALGVRLPEGGAGAE